MTFEKIMENENINGTRQSTIKCIEIIEMLERIIIREGR